MILSRVLPSGEFQSVTTGAGWDFDPATAPDGTVAYVSARSGAFEIWTTTSAGQVTQLTSISGSDVARPTWSPDGSSIAFVAINGRGAELYTVLRDGAQLRQLTHDATDKRDPTYVKSGQLLLYVERVDGKWRLMQIALADPNAGPRVVLGGQGWKTLRAGPDGVIFGQRDGDDTIHALNTQALRSDDSASSHVAITIENYSRLGDSGPHVADIDVWAVGSEGIYVRRGRRVREPSSIWLYPWNQAGRKLADSPFAAGSIGLDGSGRPIFSQALEYQTDLGLLELADGA
jgi:dipeptidyl aminopeptidase/acylaminoacyl peptidase